MCRHLYPRLTKNKKKDPFVKEKNPSHSRSRLQHLGNLWLILATVDLRGKLYMLLRQNARRFYMVDVHRYPPGA
ncbi:hypothetical protein HanHA300_Chr13g0469881 [Helianthus annuus]|nr:hypothetical protein HanHA300_Chr13g0469881 [Helianthus annuus]